MMLKRTFSVKCGRLRRRSWWLLLPAWLLIAAIAHAHPGHDDALTTLQAVWRGKAAIRWMIDKRKPVNGEVLGESWNDIDGRASCSATPMFYLVSLENPAEGRTLYLLMNHSGGFMRARFDREFAELKFTAHFPMVDCDGP